MKVIVLHGDNHVASYERLQKFIDVGQDRGWDIIRIDDKSQSVSESLASQGLFEKDKLIVVNDFSLINKSDFKWINEKKNSIDGTIVIFSKKPLTKTKLKALKKIDKVEEFKLPKLIWKFLDSFYPGNSENSLKLLNGLSENEPIEFVFSLLGRHVRDVYWAKVEPETIPYPSWRVGKLKGQAAKFSSSDEIKNLVDELAKADIESKTGGNDIKDLLDFIIITKLE